MKHAKEKDNFFHRLYLSYIPNKRDNLKQIILKVFFLITLTVFIVSAVYIANYFLNAKHQDGIVEQARSVWHEAEAEPEPSVIELLLQENSDFKGWITVPNTQIDNPIYQTDNNDFYLNHNQQKQKSIYGALFFDYQNVITEAETDKNLVVYGHHMKNGSMFGNLTKYKQLRFYKQNPTVEFSTLYK